MTVNIFPVIHVESVEQVVEDAGRVLDAEVAGVFLIDHDADDDRLAAAFDAVRRAAPDATVGVNVIRRPAHLALGVLADRLGSLDGVAALWADTLGLEGGDAPAYASALAEARAAHRWSGAVFGGVAFKYQAPVADADLPRLGREAAALCEVPTTSGAATGSAPSADKLRLLREGVGAGRLAVASGVTPANVAGLVPYVTDILVSTGIAGPDGRPSTALLADLLREVRTPPD